MNTTLELIRQSGRPSASRLPEIAKQQATALREFTNRSVPATGGATPPARLTFAVVDAMAEKVPVGRYALPKVSPTADNDVTFFEVAEFRGGHRVVMLVGAPGSFRTQTLKLDLQYHALRHLLEDLVSATALFGQTTRTCGRCKSPLTRKDSRERGMGQDCWDARSEGR